MTHTVPVFGTAAFLHTTTNGLLLIGLLLLRQPFYWSLNDIKRDLRP